VVASRFFLFPIWSAMNVHILVVPYDSALRSVRMGAGPERLLDSGLDAKLRAAGHEVHVERIEADPDSLPAEIRTAFELNQALAGRVRSITEEGGIPVVLAGNCNTAVGSLAGLSAYDPGVLWFDAHGDFNTPETTVGGFLDGMALAIATGRCWRQLAAAVPGFRPVADEHVLMLGTRDLDPLERDLLAHSGITVADPQRVRTELDEDLGTLRQRTGDLYVHIDLDVLDPGEARANALAPPDGLTVEELDSVLQRIGGRFRIRAVAFTAYDPSCDPSGRICSAAARLLHTLLPAVAPAVGS
jgi:arginase